MAEPFIAEIKIFAGNFAPRNWAFCNGQLLNIAQNTALFSLVGTTYGGDGRTTFGLPDLRGRAPMQPGAGPGLTSRRIGENGGMETSTLNGSQLPEHTHSLRANTGPATLNTPDATTGLARSAGGFAYRQNVASPDSILDTGSLLPTGGGLPHNNVQPILVINFIIALTGFFPSRN